MMVAFHDYKNKLFSGKFILQFVVAHFVLIFAVFTFWIALFALFPA